MQYSMNRHIYSSDEEQNKKYSDKIKIKIPTKNFKNKTNDNNYKLFNPVYEQKNRKVVAENDKKSPQPPIGDQIFNIKKKEHNSFKESQHFKNKQGKVISQKNSQQINRYDFQKPPYKQQKNKNFLKEIKEKDHIIEQYQSALQNQFKQNQNLKSKLTEANLIIQKCNIQIQGLQDQIITKQKQLENCKVKLQESTRRINEADMEIYQIHNKLQREKNDIITKHTKEIQALRTIINYISRYQKIRFFKQGGQAQIFLCQDKKEKRTKILRVCSLEQKFKCLDFEKTLKQPQILSGLDHPNIIKIEKYWEFQSYFKGSSNPIHSISMVLEYIEDGDLSKYIGKLNKSQIKRIYKDIQSALTYLHKKNIIHRDIASKNILLKNVDKTSITAILTDLGISTILSSSFSAHFTTKYFASSYYTPPQFGQNGIVTVKNDLWSLGVVMLQMTLGKMIHILRPQKTKKYLADYEDFPIKQLQMLKKHTQNYIFADIISMLMRKNPSERMMIDL